MKLENSDEEKDLGIYVDRVLSFEGHVEKAVAKANQILGLVKRTMTYLDKDTLKLLYCSLVRPHLEYANVVWHPQYKKHIEMLEKVQRRATRLLPMMTELSYHERLRLLELPSLVYRRSRGDAIEVYKYTHGLYRSGLVLKLEDPTLKVTRGHCLKLTKNFSKTNIRRNCFMNRMTESWNRLPAEIVAAPSVNCFKGRFDRHWEGHQYETDPDRFYQAYK